jgi:hypothetical protein
MNATNWGVQHSMANIFDKHTCPICRMNMITSSVFLMEGELLQVAGDVISDSTIRIPISVHTICSRH